MQTIFNGVTFSDDDIINPEDFIGKDETNPHNIRPFLFHDHGFTQAVVFAEDLQHALDQAADARRLDQFRIEAFERGDYKEDDSRIVYLGNSGEPHDIEGLDVIELPNPRASWVAQFRTFITTGY